MYLCLSWLLRLEGREDDLTCLVVHLFTYTYNKSLLWVLFLAELNEIC